MKIEAAEKDLVGASNSSIEEVTQQTAIKDGSSASPAAPISATPRLCILPFLNSGKGKDVGNWSKGCETIDPNQLPTRREPKDIGTTNAVLSSREKLMVRGVACFIVNISSIAHDGLRGSQCTGIIMSQSESNGKHRTLIVTCSKIICKEGTLLNPVPKRPSIGSGPKYGQEVFVLARDDGLSLRARHGEVLWLEESDNLGCSYQMFLSCEVPVAGNGGAVIDHNGNIIGMSFHCSPDPALLSISTIMTCIDMWLKFWFVNQSTLIKV